MRLLIAEDDPRLSKSLVHIFKTNNYSVDSVANGNDALLYASSGIYDGFVFDIMMQGLDGLEVLKTLRRKGITTPALFLTARAEVAQRVEGLDAGADDYLPKPFSSAELLARVRAMLRRKETYTPKLLEYNGMALDVSTYELICGDKRQVLSGREFQIMEMLMQRPKAIVPSQRLMEHVWGWDADVSVSVIWVHLSNLRKKIKAIGAPVEVRSVRGAGYVLGEKQ